jgi:AcrR family transcriptional regulator
MSSQEKSFERINQKKRTRDELLRAAGELAEKGLQPSVAEVADHAGISRATAYRYFSKPEDLFHEAVLDAISKKIQPQTENFGSGSKDTAAALEDLVSQIFHMVDDNETMFRALLANSMSADNKVKRGARRLIWLSEVLEPLKKSLKGPEYNRLLYSLSLLTGIETLVVLKDVCGLDSAKAEDVTLWAAKTLLAATVAK